jgi:hypothetical protein
VVKPYFQKAIFPSPPHFGGEGRVRGASILVGCLGQVFPFLFHPGDQRGSQEGKADQDRDEGDRAGQEDPPAAHGHEQRLAQGFFQHWAQDQRQDGGCEGIFEFLEEITDDPEDHHDRHFRGVIIEAVGSHEAKEENEGEQEAIGDF